jgi:hypothetical protein
MGREYKIRMPVMTQTCANCELDSSMHVDGKCLFEASDFRPGKVRTTMKTVKARITCGRCGGKKLDPEHVGPCGECA